MAFHLFLPFAVLAVVPVDAVTIEQPGQSVTETVTPAVEYGRVAGAASQCPEIDADHLRNAIAALNIVLMVRSGDGDAFQVASRQFNAGMQEGVDAITYGIVTCDQTDAELRRLVPQEARQQPQPIRQPQPKPHK